MKKIIIAGTSLILTLGLASVSRTGMEYHLGRPAFALCTAASIRNDCCFKFIKIANGDVIARDQDDRENKAVAEFRRCLMKDIGCSVEMTEMKSKSFEGIAAICR
ncbi:MAG TPA: hypothetical protein PK573_07715 [Spirochaetota bacterium]|nr:hypothetical protein [Spirochaetota bacterium]HRZ27303.1 hypothetical protein [Spirochaetota bacterium]HSA14387.1 hypothetical protein [Spirochaetota bacterium]